MMILGICSLILDPMGVQFSFMMWMSTLQGTLRLLIYILMIFGGLAIAYLNVTDWREDPEKPVDLP